MKELKSDFIKKFLSFSVGGYISTFIGVLTVPLITRIISPEQYGIFSIFNTFSEVLSIICCLGMEQSFVRFFYSEELENRGRLLYSSLYFPFFISLILFTLIFLFKDKVSSFILNENNKLISFLLIFNALFGALKLFSFSVVRMQQRGKAYSFLNILAKVLEFAFIIILFEIYQNDYKVLILASLFSLVIVVIFSIVLEKNIWFFRNKNKSKISKKELLIFGIPLVFTTILLWIFTSTDKIMIKLFSNLEEVGFYAGAFKIISLLIVIQTGFTSFWTPVVYEHYENNPKDTIFFKKANNYLSFIFFFIGIVVLMSRNIIIILLGNKYYESMYIMPMLVFAPIMYTISETTVMGINFKKKSVYFIYISIIISIINIAGNMLLVPVIGARGAAISTGFSYIIYFILRTYFSQKLINFNFDLKRLYFIIILMLIYSLFLTFYNNLFLTIGIGILLLILLLIVYIKVIKEGYKNLIRK